MKWQIILLAVFLVSFAKCRDFLYNIAFMLLRILVFFPSLRTAGALLFGFGAMMVRRRS